MSVSLTVIADLQKKAITELFKDADVLITNVFLNVLVKGVSPRPSPGTWVYMNRNRLYMINAVQHFYLSSL